MRLLAVVLFLSALAYSQRVTLVWTQSADPIVSSNNVYRSTTTGTGYTKIYASSSPITTWDDTTVVRGVTYYYVVTAVDANSTTPESLYSNEVSALIPTRAFAIQGNVKIQGKVAIQ